MSDKVSYMTMTALSRELKLHRSTLVRMEQRNVIPPAPFFKGMRVYSPDLVKQVKKALDDYFGGRPIGKAGRLEIDPDLVEIER